MGPAETWWTRQHHKQQQLPPSQGLWAHFWEHQQQRLLCLQLKSPSFLAFPHWLHSGLSYLPSISHYLFHAPVLQFDAISFHASSRVSPKLPLGCKLWSVFLLRFWSLLPQSPYLTSLSQLSPKKLVCHVSHREGAWALDSVTPHSTQQLWSFVGGWALLTFFF